MLRLRLDLEPLAPTAHVAATTRILIFFALIVCFAALFAGCGPIQSDSSAASAGQDRVATISIDDFPNEIGRGYPIVIAYPENDTATGVEPGEVAANFGLELADGNALSLHDLQGRPVMLNFWATWCGPCRIEMPEIVEQYESDDQLIVLAINVREDFELVQAFSNQFSMSMPVVQDRDGELQNLYGVRGMPTSIFIDRDGIIVARFAGIVTGDRLQEFLQQIL